MTHSIILDQQEREAAIKTLVQKPFTRTDIAAMKKKEVEVLGDLARDLSERDLALTLRTLNHLQDSLDQMLNRC